MHCSNISGVISTRPPPREIPFKTNISSVERAARASPFAKTAIASNILSGIEIFIPPNPRSSVRARERSRTNSSSFSAFKTNTLQRERSAPFISNDGFSVVAPINIMLPFSTNGKNASCCALLNRWISSTKSIVLPPKLPFCSALCITERISFIPLVTAEKSTNSERVLFAMILASVVLPTPGGPQKTIDEILSPSIILYRTLPLPSKCVCPTNSDKSRGRSLAARGCDCAPSEKDICRII
ncbi:unknown [Coraliomargarita sp. CAG:312]|nr:unknown [Coraliomargarita sp. CAG:312]